VQPVEHSVSWHDAIRIKRSVCQAGVRFSVWVSFRVGIRVKARVRLRVYLSCLLHFCQACCRWNLGGKVDAAINLSQAYNKL